MNNTPITAQQLALAMITYGDDFEAAIGRLLQRNDSSEIVARFRSRYCGAWARFERLAAADRQAVLHGA